MTVFSDGSKEPLHGHNFRVELEVHLQAETSQDPHLMLSFSDLKLPLRAVLKEWDERVLLAERCSEFKIAKQDGVSIDFYLCGARYVLPRSDVVLLPVSNITSEALAAELLRRLMAQLPTMVIQKLKSIELLVEETRGQGASVVWSQGEARV